MKRMCIYFFAAVACVGLVLATDFVWDDGGSANAWSDEDNWEGNSGFPDGTADTATFPANSGTKWTVTQEAQDVDSYGDVTIKENVDFDGIVTLHITALIIDASAVSSTSTIVVKVTDSRGEVKANG